MSLAHTARLTASASARVRAPAASSASVVLARRWLASSPARSAQVDPFAGDPKHTHDHLHAPAGVRSPSLKTATFTAADEPGRDVDPYKGGPGALEKAVHLFFFTEILRGQAAFSILFSHLFPSTGKTKMLMFGLICRNVGRDGAVLQTAVYDHVPL